VKVKPRIVVKYDAERYWFYYVPWRKWYPLSWFGMMCPKTALRDLRWCFQ
jgi:hypothetical protein